jgi:hypothetical protein
MTFRFDFSFMIPGNLAPHDYHPTARIDNRVYAELTGIQEESSLLSPSKWFKQRSVPIPTPANRANTPSIHQTSPNSSTPPSYADTTNHGKIPESEWIKGVYTVDRLIRLTYNPDPAGGVTSLDVRIDDYAPGLGGYTIRYLADEVCGSNSGTSVWLLMREYNLIESSLRFV